jgi:hypothetical protein
VKDATIFSRTSEVGGIKRETVQLAGCGSQRVMFAHGPGADIILKATGTPLRVVSIGEAVRRTHRPVTLKVDGSGPKEKRDRGDSLPSEPDRAGRWGMPAKEHFTPPPDGSWPSVGPGNSHGNGGAGHGKGKE